MSQRSVEQLLEHELDAALGQGPALAPPQERLRAGRRALRRRRVAQATALAAVVAVLGGGYALTGPGVQGRAVPPVAADPSPSAPDRTEPESPTPPPWQGNAPVRYWNGELEIRDGVTVHQHLVNPFAYPAPQTSDALDLTWRGQRQWVIAQTDRRGRELSTSMAQPSNGWADFAAYVAAETDLTTGGADGWPETVRLTAGDQVAAVPGAEVLHRTDDPRLGARFAPAGTPTGAALVRPPGEEQAYFVVWRVVDAELDVITTPPADVVGATWEQLLTYARSQYANGEGLR